MILRRIASAVRHQDWAAVLIELTGVLIALAASNLYTQRIERRSELIMLDQLRGGLVTAARAQVLQLVDRIDAELGGKAKAVPGGAEA